MAWTKLDDDIAADDAACHSFIPLRLVGNLADPRYMGGFRHFERQVSGAEAATYIPQLQTHPDYWASIPMLVPRDLHMDQITIVLTGASSDAIANVNVRAALSGNVSASTTFTSATIADKTAAVAIPDDVGGWMIVEAQIKSDAASPIDSGDSLNIIETRRGLILADDGAITPATIDNSEGHLMVVTFADSAGGSEETARSRFFVGNIAPSGDVADRSYYVWPATDGATTFSNNSTGTKSYDTATLAQVGRLGLYGVGWYYSSTVGSDYPNSSDYEAGTVMHAAHARQLDAYQWDQYRRTRHVLGMGPIQNDTRGMMCAIVSNTSTTVHHSFYEVRADVTAITVAVLCCGDYGRATETDVTTTLTLTQVTGGSATQTATDTRRVPAIAPKSSPYRAGSLAAYGLAQHTWFGKDLGYGNDSGAEWQRMTLIELVAALPSGIAVGEEMLIEVTMDGDYVVVFATTAVEQISGTRG